jgi:hypothetical protein
MPAGDDRDRARVVDAFTQHVRPGSFTSSNARGSTLRPDRGVVLLMHAPLRALEESSTMKRPLLASLPRWRRSFAASAAEAARVNWSIGVDVAPVSAYVSSGPVWHQAPAAYVPRRAGLRAGAGGSHRAPCIASPSRSTTRRPRYGEAVRTGERRLLRYRAGLRRARTSLWLPPAAAAAPAAAASPPWERHRRWHTRRGPQTLSRSS